MNSHHAILARLVLGGILALACAAPLHAQSLAWAPTNGPFGGTISVLAAQGNEVYAGSSNGGVFHSTDGGVTWSEPDRTLRHIGISALAIAPNGHVFACGNALLHFDDTLYGGYLYRSTDHGASWRPAPSRAERLYATMCAVMPDGALVVVSGAGKVMRTTDEGTTWSVLGDIGPQDGRPWMAAAPDGALFISIAEEVTDGRLYVLRAGGGPPSTSWWIHNGGIVALTPTLDGNLLLYTSGGLMRSTDHGKSWAPFGTGVPPYLRSLATDSTGTIYAGTDGYGVHRSTDGGASWSPTAPATQIWRVGAIAVAGNGAVVTGCEGDGIYRSTNAGTSWQWTNDGLVASNVTAVATAASGHLFATTTGNAIHRSTDGVNWTRLRFDHANLLSLLATSDGALYVGTIGSEPGDAGLHRSTDDGETWERIADIAGSDIAADDDGTLYVGNVTELYRRRAGDTTWSLIRTQYPMTALRAEHGGNVYVGDFYQGLYRSSDEGATWTLAGSNENLRGLNSIVGNGSRLIAAGDVFFESHDQGQNWESIGRPTRGGTPFTAAMDRRGTLLAGTTGAGAFISTASGSSWIPANGGLTSVDVTAVGFDSTGRALAGTAADGLFRSTNAMAVPDAGLVPTSRIALECLPNPCTSSMRATFTLDAPARTAIDLYDARGERVRSTAETLYPAGEHAIAIDTRELAGGVYTVRLRAGGDIRTRMMIVVR